MRLKLERPIIFFDLETTGIKVTEDRIIEIGMIKISPDGEEKSLLKRVNPKYPISKEASEVHHIYYDDIKDEPTFAEIANELIEFIGDADLGGYNSIKFDVPMLVEEFYRVGIEFDLKKRRQIDVMNIFMRMEPRNLKAAYKFYCNKELKDAHSAMADIKATYEILLAQLDRYKDTEYEDKEGNIGKPIQNNIKALSSFSYHNKNADLAGQIIYNKEGKEIFNFGKYKGRSVEEVFLSEPNYYAWMMNAKFPKYTKKVITEILNRVRKV
jgi:DNA polymerase-3 subunit epsilon